MYITSYDQLHRELDARRAKRAEIRERVDAFVYRTYGISGMLDLLPKHFGFLTEDGPPVGFLARQIASICTEDTAFEIGAPLLGLRPATVTFGRDTFTVQNHDKLYRVKVPWTKRSKKGTLVIAYERVTPLPNSNLENRPLDRILAPCGTTLPMFHANLRQRLGMTGALADTSALHQQMLATATRRPDRVLREYEETWEYGCAPDEILLRDRPPAEWYYPYYLSWFADGDMVLFETYDSPHDSVSSARTLFEACMRRVEREIGCLPLIVKIPPLTREMLYCNRHLLDTPDALATLTAHARGLDRSDTVSFFNSIAESVIQFR